MALIDNQMALLARYTFFFKRYEFHCFFKKEKRKRKRKREDACIMRRAADLY
jgi:hypothetical protein